MKSSVFLFIIFVFLCLWFPVTAQIVESKKYLDNLPELSEEECTIGVASGSATSDGRPLVWKSRDWEEEPNNEVYYNTNYRYKFVSVVNAGESSVRMGVNEKGLALVNSTANDIDDGSTTGLYAGSFMRYVLGTCATIIEMENVLDSTNITGRQTSANIAVIDSTGAAAIFETSGHQYWKFDANDTSQAPNGYIVRTNFAFNGGGTGGIERYNRTVDLIADFYSGDNLNHKSILRRQMRDFSDSNSNPVPVPYPHKWSPSYPFGYIYTKWSICRYATVSAAVIHGVFPTESARLSTMWAILGQPATSIAVPYWSVGPPPNVSNSFPTAPLCDKANQIKSLLFDVPTNTQFINSYKLRDELGNGIWKNTFAAEDSVISVVDSCRNIWQTILPTNNDMLTIEQALADYAFAKISQEYGVLAAVTNHTTDKIPDHYTLKQNYPNPFNPATNIQFSLPRTGNVSLKIINLLGQEVDRLVFAKMPAGNFSVQWNAADFASGIYFYRIEVRSPDNTELQYFIDTKRMVVIK